MQTVNFKQKNNINTNTNADPNENNQNKSSDWLETSKLEQLTHSSQFSRTNIMPVKGYKDSGTQRRNQRDGVLKSRQCTGKNSKNSKKSNNIQSRSRSKSRSSSSSYCVAGCLKRSLKNPKPQSQKSKDTSKPQKTKQKYQKLCWTIQKFYTNLSSMPLDMLITHTDPHSWLQEQHDICEQLERKLSKVGIAGKQNIDNGNQYNNTNTNNKNNKNNKIQQADSYHQEDKYKYYKSMLTAITGILQNIQKNINLLGQLHRQQLNRYNSNTTVSISSSGNSGKKNYTPISPTQTSDFPSSIPSPSRKVNGKQIQEFTNQQSLYEIKGQGEQGSGEEDYHRMLAKLNDNLGRLLKGPQNPQPPPNPPTTTTNITHLLSTCRSQQSPQPHKKLTQIQKNYNHQTNHHHHPNQQIKSKSFVSTADMSGCEKTDVFGFGKQDTRRRSCIFGGEDRIQGISQLFAMSIVNCTDRDPQKIKNLLLKFASTVTTCLPSPSPSPTPAPAPSPSPSPSPSPTPASLQPLISQICHLKQELQQKNTSIENILRSNQQYESIIELYKKAEENYKQNISYGQERIRNLEALVDKYERDIGTQTTQTSNLHCTLQKTTTSLSTILQQKCSIQKKLQSQITQTNRLSLQLQNTKEELAQQIKKAKTRENVAMQKMEIYKQKYYRGLHQRELQTVVGVGRAASKRSRGRGIQRETGVHRERGVHREERERETDRDRQWDRDQRMDTKRDTRKGKGHKTKEIWDILAQHRRDLQQIDSEDSDQYSGLSISIMKKQYKPTNEAKYILQDEYWSQNQQQIPSSLSLSLLQKQTTRKHPPSPNSKNSLPP